jgi:tetratricopeptide (TPR) repeat protein/DNA-binding XRE family transcriptional regulator
MFLMKGTLPSSFGEMLKVFRLRRRLTQQALASSLDVHRNTIGAWERGDYLPESKTMMLELAQCLRLNEQEKRKFLEASLTALSPYWHLPSPRNPFFTGREEVLQVLHSKLRADQAVALTQSYALHGLGGIGKTQIALEYAYRHSLEYAAIFWIGAESPERIVSSFLHVADLLGLPEQQESDQRRVVAAVQRWLNNHRQWLLIWDNVDDIAVILPFLPSSRQGAMLFTTRRQTLGTLAYGMELQPMTEDEGVLFLLRRSRVLDPTGPVEQVNEIECGMPTEYAAARELAEAMGCLPLALDQVGAYVEETPSSLVDYLVLYRTRSAALLGQRGTAIIDHPASVVATLSLSFEKVEQANTAAADLLRLCAFLHPDTIPEGILTEGAGLLGEQLGTAAADTFKLDEAIRTACAYSLLNRNAREHTLSTHRLVQAVLRGGLDGPAAQQWMARTVRAVNAGFPKTVFANWTRCELWMPQAQACRLLIEQAGSRPPEAGALLFKVGNYLLERGRYAEAEPFLAQAVELGEQQPEVALPVVATSLDRLAELYWRQNRYERAEPLWERALVIRERHLGPDHPQTAESLNNLAALYWNQGKHKQAETLWERALAIRERHLGPDHPLTAESLNNLAFLYRHQEKYEQAESLSRRALAIRERHLGPDHPLTALSLSNLALLYRFQEQHEQAETLLLRALKIHEEQLGPDDHQTALSLERLAEFYQDQGREGQAESLWRRALAIRERQFGLDHPSTANCLLALALIAAKSGEGNQAEQSSLQALTIYEQRLGPAHPETAVSLTRVALLYQSLGKYEQAEALYRRAFAVFEQLSVAQSHPKVLQARRNYTTLSQQMARVDRS